MLKLFVAGCRWPRDQSALVGVDGSSTADGSALQNGTVRGVARLLNMPRECMERCISVRTQCVLKVCRVADAVSYVSKADTEQDQSVYVMIISRQSVLQNAVYVLVSITVVGIVFC